MTSKPRPFLAFDGEGIGAAYVLLANSQHNIYNRRGLSTAACLEFILGGHTRRVVRVIYVSAYDVAHICRDVPDQDLLKLYAGEVIAWRGYELCYLAGKVFRVKHGRRSVTIYDVRSFFDAPFVQVCHQVLGDVPEIIIRGKAERAHFNRWTKADLIAYNRAECVALEQVCEKLRAGLAVTLKSGPSLLPGRWHGPGAVAARVLKATSASFHTYPERTYLRGFQQLLAIGYFGGRIEVYTLGHTPGSVYRYDIHSAYPAAMRLLPRLTWRWSHVRDFLRDAPFALYHLRWSLAEHPELHSWPAPLPHRGKLGAVTFAGDGEGWYWSPEVERVMTYYPGVEVVEGYVMETDDIYPLRDAVEELYALRLDYRAAGLAAAGPLKKCLNAIYGKMVQREGSKRYHSFAWAGYLTSLVRARLLDCIALNPGAVLAATQDGLITNAPLRLHFGVGLGEWEEQTFSSATILARGVYCLGELDDPASVQRWRGFNVNRFPFERALAQIKAHGQARLTMRLFITPKLAILAPQSYGSDRLTFRNVTRSLAPFASRKRHWYTARPGGDYLAYDLAHTAVHSRMIVSPPGERAPMSWPYLPNPWPDDAMELQRGVEVAALL